MKENILEALKTKFKGVSDAILERIADKLAKNVSGEEEVATAVEGVTFQHVLDSYGDSRANEAQRTAIRNYEKKYNIKGGQPIEKKLGDIQPEGGAAENNGGDGVPEWAQQLIKSNQELTDKLSRLEGDRTTEERRQQLGTILEKLPENLRKAYGRTPVDKLTDEEFEALKSEITGEVDNIVKDVQAKGAVFGRPSATAQTVKTELSKEQLNAISQRISAPKEGQPF